VQLHFLQAGELHEEIERLIALYEQQCGRRRQDFAREDADALVDDYRLATCLQATLGAWYAWRQPSWEEALSKLSAQTQAALTEAVIDTPIALRLALFDYVHAHHAGFLDEQARPQALATFAALYGVPLPHLAYLLALDSDNEAVLTRIANRPQVAAVASRYNQGVFEAALYNASQVCFLVDCEAFLQAWQDPTTGTRTGPGAVVKRLCYLARRLGVYYDLAYEETAAGRPSTLLRLTLYGPQELTGSARQYGQRLAHLCRLLLDYGVASTPHPRARRQDAMALGQALRRAEATVHLFQQAYRFAMDDTLLALLPTTHQEHAETPAAGSAAVYDSSVEQSFAEAFASLERMHSTDGWHLEREPEPLLFSWPEGNNSGILIPDFVLARGTRRIYLEILGFWTPAYRERKMQKLQHLKGQVDLVLALPVEAHQAFAGLAPDYPLIEYRGQLSVMPLLHTLQERYDDFEVRLAALDTAHVRASVQAQGLIPERACYQLLHCYRRSELACAAERVLQPGACAYTPGVGIYLTAWLEHLHRSFVEWIETQGRHAWPLPALLQACRNGWPQLAGCEDAAIETLLSAWPEVQIQRDSLFEATVIVGVLPSETETPAPQREVVSPLARKVVRERRTGSRKAQETSQQNLWEG
jgi:predicted nuclease of restriction endonuclease-like RecB superfamily